MLCWIGFTDIGRFDLWKYIQTKKIRIQLAEVLLVNSYKRPTKLKANTNMLSPHLANFFSFRLYFAMKAVEWLAWKRERCGVINLDAIGLPLCMRMQIHLYVFSIYLHGNHCVYKFDWIAFNWICWIIQARYLPFFLKRKPDTDFYLCLYAFG